LFIVFRRVEVTEKSKSLKFHLSNMLPEPYAGLLIGALLTLGVSICTMILTNHFSERQWRRQKHGEDRRVIMEQVYSPLYFFLDDLTYSFSALAGYLSAIDTNDIENTDAKGIAKMFEDDLNKIDSQVLRTLMEKKLGFIAPSGFREDLLSFLWLLDSFRSELSGALDYSFWEDISLAKRRVESYQKVTHYYRIVIDHFRTFLNEEVFEKETDLSEIKYESFLNENRFNKIKSFLNNEPLNPIFEKQFDDLRKEAKRDLGIE
jgi:hypothetical protein